MNNIAPSELSDKIRQGGCQHLIDVRSLPEFNAERIDARCCNLPLNQIQDQINTLGLEKGAEIILLCASGSRSTRAREALIAQGYTNIYSLDGGLANWKAHKLPIKRTKGTLPIMRQVQIAAGILILTGTLGSLFVTSGLIWLAIFVGAGLTFAGLSGWCGMAILLGKMPWNKKLQVCSP